jgi:hypothetical protein
MQYHKEYKTQMSIEHTYLKKKTIFSLKVHLKDRKYFIFLLNMSTYKVS